MGIDDKRQSQHEPESVRHGLAGFLRHWTHRPLSSVTALTALGLILAPLYQLLRGQSYFAPLNNIDQTTLIMLGLLLLRMVFVFRFDSDLQAVSLALVGSLAFIYTFEAIYKWAFYVLPWKIPPAELRELVIQAGIALTGLVGFAFGRFRRTQPSKIFTAVFLLGWVFWILVGYPQIFDEHLYRPVVLNISLSHGIVYLVNRGVKFSLFLAIFFAARPSGKNRPAGTEDGEVE